MSMTGGKAITSETIGRSEGQIHRYLHSLFFLPPFLISKVGGTGDRYGDYLCVKCNNFPCITGFSHFTNTKFTRPITKISKSTHFFLASKVSRMFANRRLAFIYFASKVTASMVGRTVVWAEKCLMARTAAASTP